MGYTPTTWVDRFVQNPGRFRVTDNGDGTITLTPEPGAVTAAGTPVSAANMNHIEQGIAASLPKDGSEAMTGRLVVSAGPDGGVAFPRDAFGGSGDSASITLRQKSGEDQELTVEMSNDPADTINLKTPSPDGVCVNGHRVWHAGNVTPLDVNTGGTVNNSVSIGNGHGLHFPAFGMNYLANGNGDQASYGQFNMKMHGHWGLGMEAYDNSVNGFYDFRAGRWTTRNGFVVDNGGEKFQVNGNGDMIQRGTVLASTRVNNGVLEFWNGGWWQPVGGVKNVQRGEARMTSDYMSSSHEAHVSISPVNMAKASVNFPNISGNSHNNTFYNGYCKLVNPTTLYIRTGESGIFQWEVIEYY